MDPHPPAAPAPSGMAQAGSILLLVGAILAALGALMLGFMSMMMLLLDDNETLWQETMFPAFIAPMYGVMAVMAIAGAIVGFVAWSRSRTGDMRSAGILGIVASLLPPLQAVILVGGILCLVSPEAQAAKQGWQGQAP